MVWDSCGETFGAGESMINLILLAVGGACGAISRHQIGAIILKHKKHTFPVSTFLINSIGALLLGIFCGLNINGNLYLLLGDGFCGAFTTFSTFSLESVQLVRGRARKKAVLFVALSVFVGFSLFAVGYESGTLML